MVSLKQLFEWFTTGKFPTEAQFAEQFKSFWHKTEKLPIEQIYGLQEEISNVTTKFKGYHTTLADLQTAYPQNENIKDFFAWVGSPYPGTVWKVFEKGGAWTDTGEVPTQEEIDLAEYAKKTDLDAKADKNPDVTYAMTTGMKDITTDVLAKVVQHKAINQTTGAITNYNYTDAVLMYKLKPNTEYVIEGLGFNPALMGVHFTLNFYPGESAARSYGIRNTAPNVAFGFTTNSVDLYVAFYIKVYNINSAPENYDSYSTLRVYEADDSGVSDYKTSLKTVGGTTLINDVNRLLTYSKSDNTIQQNDITDAVKGSIVSGKALQTQTGSIINWAFADTVLMYKLKANTTYNISGLNNPQLTEPMVCRYKTDALNTEASIKIANSGTGSCTFTTGNDNLYMSFMVKVASGVVGNDFDSTNTIKIVETSKKYDSIQDQEGSVLIKNTPAVVYFDRVESQRKDVTNDVLSKVALHKSINSTTGAIGNYNYYDVVLMYRLKPDTKYVIEGLGFDPALMADHFTLNFYPGESAARSYAIRNEAPNIPFEFTTNKTDLYVTFFIKVYNLPPNDLQNYDSYDTLRIYEYPSSLKLVDREGNVLSTGAVQSSGNGVDIPNPDKNLPKKVGRLDFTGSFSGIGKDNAVNVGFKLDTKDGTIIDCRALVTYQGTSSMVYPKKNYSFDLIDENGDSVKVRFGDWVVSDSYHLKANYIDAMHNRNICCARVLEQMYMSRDVAERRPWNLHNDFDPKSNEARFDTGALGHIDGFPIEIYINGVYQGLFTFNLKKHRDNYCMKKDNPKHIQLEMAQDAYIQIPINWGAWEIRNPKGFTANAEPPVGDVKNSIVSFFTWANSVTAATSKDEFKDHLVIPSWIDFRILNMIFDIIDSNCKNTQLCTWDGVHWAALSYDLDTIIGMHWQGTSIWRNPQSDTDAFLPQPFTVKFAAVFNDEISARYAELRQKGIISVSNIVNVFNQFFTSIGIDVYKKDWDKWKEIPSNRDGSLTYPNQPTTGGFYMDILQIEEWITERIAYTDNMYGYS